VWSKQYANYPHNSAIILKTLAHDELRPAREMSAVRRSSEMFSNRALEGTSKFVNLSQARIQMIESDR